MAKYLEEKKSILVASFDISKMFDKVDAHFCLEKAYSSNVRGKIYRMLYQMNKNIKVKVKTPVGVTPLKSTGLGMAQGSVDAAVMSSNAVEKGVDEALNDVEGIISYEDIPIPSQIWMDDILKMSETAEDAQLANDAIEE